MNLAVAVIIASIVALLVIRYALLSRRKYGTHQRQTEHEPNFDGIDVLDSDLADLGFGDPIEDDILVEESFTEDAFAEDIDVPLGASETSAEIIPQRPVVTAEPAPVITFNVFPSTEEQFIGYDLLQALATAGLCFGKHNIFHRHIDRNGEGDVIFSLASAKEPGTFDMQKMAKVSSDGLILFMQLKGTSVDIDNFDLLLATAQQLAEDLNGNLLDERRQVLTSHKIAAYRQRIQRYNFSTLEM